MPGIPLQFCSDTAASPRNVISVGFWFKMHGSPPHSTALVDIDGSTIGFIRCFWSDTGHIALEASYHGGYCLVNLNPHYALLTDQWYWCTFGFGTNSSGLGGLSYDEHTSFIICGEVVGPGGAGDGAQFEFASPGTHSDLVSCAVGWGVNLTGMYDSFPNAPGYDLFGLGIYQHSGSVMAAVTFGLQSVPTSDPSPGGYTALYLVHQPVGDLPGTLLDSTSNHYDMYPGPHGLTIVAEAPY